MDGIQSQAGLDLWEVRENRTEMHRTASTASRTGCFSRISTEIRLILTPIVDGMLGQPVTLAVLSDLLYSVQL